MKWIPLWAAALIILMSACPMAAAARAQPIAIQFINQAQDIPGLWDPTTRSDFVQAMNIAAVNVSNAWLNGRPVVISSDLRSRWRLLVVDHSLTYLGVAAAGFHSRDAVGPYAIFSLAAADESLAEVFLDGSHELEEMLVDPSAERFIRGWYAEVADPVVCCHYSVTLSDGSMEPLNDFVLPHWFMRRAPGPYDFIDSPFVQHPLQTGPDGFAQHE